MPYDPIKHHRRSIRLKGYDYSLAGAYFVTICAQNRECLFGEIADGEMHLNAAGAMIVRWWDQLSNKFPTFEPDSFVVMPNHIHCIVVITNDDHVGATLRGRPGPGTCEQTGQEQPPRPEPGQPARPGPGQPPRPEPGQPPRPDQVGATLRRRPGPGTCEQTEPGQPPRPEPGQPPRPDQVGATLRRRPGPGTCEQTEPGQPPRPEPGQPARPGPGQPPRPEPGQPARPGPGQPPRPEPGQPHRVAPTTAITRPTLGDMMDWFKTMVTNEYIRGVKQLGWKPFFKKVLQRNYYEHIIRNEGEFDAIRRYIQNNPANWKNDRDNLINVRGLPPPETIADYLQDVGILQARPCVVTRQ